MDPTLLKYKGKWWMLVSKGGSISGTYDLLAFYADTPIGGTWTPHPDNPILVDDWNARSAGNAFVGDDYVIYFSQQSGTDDHLSLKYGTKVRGYKFDLTTTDFSRTELATSPIISNSCIDQNEVTCTSFSEQWNSDGVHTLNMWLTPDGVSGLAVVDGFSRVTYKYSIGLYEVVIIADTEGNTI
jgi:hypothetical protein